MEVKKILEKRFANKMPPITLFKGHMRHFFSRSARFFLNLGFAKSCRVSIKSSIGSISIGSIQLSYLLKYVAVKV